MWNKEMGEMRRRGQRKKNDDGDDTDEDGNEKAK